MLWWKGLHFGTGLNSSAIKTKIFLAFVYHRRRHFNEEHGDGLVPLVLAVLRRVTSTPHCADTGCVGKEHLQKVGFPAGVLPVRSRKCLNRFRRIMPVSLAGSRQTGRHVHTLFAVRIPSTPYRRQACFV